MVCVSLVAVMFTNVSYAEIDPEHIAGIWFLDEDKGDEVEDRSENGNNGAIRGNVEWVEGKFGKALEFDGVDGFVEVVCSNIGTEEQLTVSVLVKPDSQTAGNFGDHKDIVRSHCFGSGKWGICTLPGFNASNLLQIHVAWIEGGDLWWRTAGDGMAVKDEWNSLTVVWDRDLGKTTLYRNGEPVGETKPPVGARPITTGFRIGNDCAGPFKGIVDEIAIFNAALDEGDIKLIAAKGLEQALTGAAVDITDKLTTSWGQLKSSN